MNHMMNADWTTFMHPPDFTSPASVGQPTSSLDAELDQILNWAAAHQELVSGPPTSTAFPVAAYPEHHSSQGYASVSPSVCSSIESPNANSGQFSYFQMPHSLPVHQVIPQRRKVPTETCLVCNDHAEFSHYGAITCEGCKGFFKRSVQSKRQFICSHNNNCIITPKTRAWCKLCRFRKCCEVGMDENFRSGCNAGRRGRLPTKKLN